MPLREYLCLECGHQFEVYLGAHEDPPETCNHCESARIERLPGIPGGYKIKGDNGASTRPKYAGGGRK